MCLLKFCKRCKCLLRLQSQMNQTLIISTVPHNSSCDQQFSSFSADRLTHEEMSVNTMPALHSADGMQSITMFNLLSSSSQW